MLSLRSRILLFAPTLAGAYTAGPGWDYVSGWGTPVLTPLMTDIDGANTRPVQ